MKKCALVVGHKKSSPGASNANYKINEFDFNDKLSKDIEDKVANVEVQRIYRRTYNELPNDINDYNPDFIISLHCNAFNKKVSGCEILFYYKSSKGRWIAELLNSLLVDSLGINDRGIKPKTVEDRGGYLLKNTKAPCIIAEPFFIDNDNDFIIAQEKYSFLVDAYAKGIEQIAKNI